MSLRHKWTALWRRISKPNPAIQPLNEQQQAHLLISILAALLLAGLFIIPIWVITNPEYPSALPIGTGLYIGLLIAYAYSRTQLYRVGAWLLIASMYALIISTLLTAPESLPERLLVLNFLAIGILLASLLLSVRATALFAVVSMLIVVPYFFVPEVHFAIAYSFLVFILITSSLVLTSTIIRRNYVLRLQASEERYRVLGEAVPDLMFRNKRDGTFVDYHATAQEMLAYDPKFFMGKTIRQVFPPYLADICMASIEKVLQSGKMDVFEYKLEVQGDERYFEGRMVPSGPDETLIIVRDMTERHHAEVALKHSEQRFSTAFRNSPVPMVISTTDATNPIYIEANDAYLRLVGYTWNELKGQSLTQVGIPIQDERRTIRRATLDEQGYYAVREAQIYNRHHEIRDVLISAQRIQLNDVECDLELMLDVTEQRRLEKIAVELEMEAKNVQILSKFIQDASHEFRTPLADINNRIYLLNRLDDATKRQRHADHAQKQIHALTNLLDMLFIMARLDGGLPFEPTPINVNHFLRGLLSVYELQLEAQQLTLVVDLNADVPMVKVHEELLLQAVRQVMDNAIRYNSAGGTITVRTETTPDALLITIADTGMGILPDDLPHVFERFWRHDEAHSTPGFGLGLSIARRILHQHGGDISITSPGKDQGTVVTITLPFVPLPTHELPHPITTAER